ncbi:PAS domain-containing protein [Falsiroseomonas bella]|nr:PAS domain-containing protein [Falsiroseomonas bella]
MSDSVAALRGKHRGAYRPTTASWSRMRGLRAALLVAVLVPALLLALSAWRSWDAAWRSAETEVMRTADAAAEFARRLLEAQLLRIERANDILAGLSDAEVRIREDELQSALRAAAAERESAERETFYLFVYDRDAYPLVTSAAVPAARSRRMMDREFNRVLRPADAPPFYVSPVYVGRDTGRAFFAVTARRERTGNGLPAGTYDGVVNASAYLDHVNPALAALAATPDDVVALIRMDGALLARSAGFKIDPAAAEPRLLPGGPMLEVMARGDARAIVRARSPMDDVERIAALRRVGGSWPVYVSAARDRGAVIAAWRREIAPQAVITAVSAMLLALLAGAVLRRQHSLEDANETLEARVAERAAALAESEIRFRALVDVGPNFVWFATPDGALHYLNDRWFEFTGQRQEDALPDGWATTLHPDDAARTAATWAQARARGVTYEIEVRYRRHDGEYRWYLARAEPLRDATGRIEAWFGSSTDIHDLKAAQAALAESEARLRLAQEAGGVGSWEWDLGTGALFWSESCHRLHGTDPAVPVSYETWRDGIHPEDLPGVERAVREALEGRATGWAVEFRFRRRDNGTLRWIAGRAEVVHDPETGRALRVHGVGLDVTERRDAEERQALMTRELDHRAKNALAAVQAAVRLTPKHDPEAYARAIEGRVSALARAHTILAAGKWEGAALRALVEAELAPFETPVGEAAPDVRRVAVDGPDVALAPDAVQALSMALHELATNAAKHGALSVPGGRVSLSWRVEEGAGLLVLNWRERGGPPIIEAPVRRGFGSRVLEATLGTQLGGRVERRWEAGGLDCEIAVPIARVLAGSATQCEWHVEASGRARTSAM